MRTVLQSLKEMESSLLQSQTELEALEQIEVLKEQLSDRPGAIDLIAKLQAECAPEAERTKSELELIRDAIEILEDQPFLPEARLEPEVQADSLSNHDSELVLQH